jgi:hypothetical protein
MDHLAIILPRLSFGAQRLGISAHQRAPAKSSPDRTMRYAHEKEMKPNRSANTAVVSGLVAVLPCAAMLMFP